MLYLAHVRLRQRRLARELAPVAWHLDHDLASLQRRTREPITIHVGGGERGPRLIIVSGWRAVTVPTTDSAVRALRGAGIRSIRLRRRLPARLLVDSILLAVHALGAGRRVVSGDLQAALLGPEGVDLPGIRMQVSADHQRLDLDGRGPVADGFDFSWSLDPLGTNGATISALAPRAGLVALLVCCLPLLLVELKSLRSLELWLVAAGVVSLCLGLAVSAIGSILHDRSRRDELLRSVLTDVGALSQFPEASPRPMWKLGRRGQVLYRNPAARRLRESFRRGFRECDLLPPDVESLVSDVIGQGGEFDIEHHVDDRVFEFGLRQFPGDDTALLVGHETTHVHALTAKLQVANARLQNHVADQTSARVSTEEALVLSLAQLAEVRDPETGRHLERTSRYVALLAQELSTEPAFADELDAETREMLTRATPLHDIGKVGVPDAILLKPGALTADEQAQMRRHTIYGGNALARAERQVGSNVFLQTARDIALYHHERWDGGGYPFGRSGEEIPLAARLMAVADVYDALVTERVYKRALPHEEAVAIIEAGSGTQFDPRVVVAFQARAHEFAQIERALSDTETALAPEDVTPS